MNRLIAFILATLLLVPLVAVHAADRPLVAPSPPSALHGADSVADSAIPAPVSLAWPKVRRPETRPWTWWWWHGSAVTKADIAANLEELHRSGIGGVNIVCLLDVRDTGAVKLQYLSKEWIEAVAHTVRESHRLGMDADMSPVPGWAFGGPWVTRNDACEAVEVRRLSLDECRRRGMRVAGFGHATLADTTWLWHPTLPDGLNSAWFRLGLDLGLDDSGVVVNTTADNAYRLFANGVECSRGDNCQYMQKVELKVGRQLSRGRNVLAVRADNQGGPGGVVLAVSVLKADGSRRTIPCRQWRCCDRKVAG